MAQPPSGLPGCLKDDPGLLADRFNGLLDLVQYEHVGGLLDRVDDIVQLGGEGVDVLTVERGDEGGVEPSQDGVGDVVAFVLALALLHLAITQTGVLHQSPLNAIGDARINCFAHF